VALISVSLALSQTSAYTARPSILCGVPVYAPAFGGTQCTYKPYPLTARRDGQAG